MISRQEITAALGVSTAIGVVLAKEFVPGTTAGREILSVLMETLPELEHTFLGKLFQLIESCESAPAKRSAKKNRACINAYLGHIFSEQSEEKIDHYVNSVYREMFSGGGTPENIAIRSAIFQLTVSQIKLLSLLNRINISPKPGDSDYANDDRGRIFTVDSKPISVESGEDLEVEFKRFIKNNSLESSYLYYDILSLEKIGLVDEYGPTAPMFSVGNFRFKICQPSEFGRIVYTQMTDPSAK